LAIVVPWDACPTECIDCGLCESVCPVAAIHADDRLPDDQKVFVDANSEFFGPAVTGWGSPGGANDKSVTALDHPLVAVYRPARPYSQSTVDLVAHF
jgi:ferredoxin